MPEDEPSYSRLLHLLEVTREDRAAHEQALTQAVIYAVGLEDVIGMLMVLVDGAVNAETDEDVARVVGFYEALYQPTRPEILDCLIEWYQAGDRS